MDRRRQNRYMINILEPFLAEHILFRSLSPSVRLSAVSNRCVVLSESVSSAASVSAVACQIIWDSAAYIMACLGEKVLLHKNNFCS